MFFNFSNKRIRIVLIGIIFVFIVIILRVFYLEVFEYRKLNDLALNLWSRNLPIEAKRGIIYDSEGNVIAGNETTVSLVLVPSQIKDKEKVATDIAKILNVSYEEMYEHVSKKTSIERVHPEGRRLSYDVADEISALNYDGVYLLRESKRYYPYDTLLSHTLGYVGIDNQGLSGLELLYDDVLTGKNGSIKYYSDAKGNNLLLPSSYEKETDGLSIGLTINLELQKVVENVLDNAVTKYNPDSALAIVMNPNNGEILAMSSRPNFSPSNYQNYDTEVISRNLPIWSTYEPGSTFKIITLASALEEGIVDLDTDTFYDGGSVNVDGATIHCWKSGGHGEQTYLQVVENSCNL